MLGVGHLDQVDMVGKFRQPLVPAEQAPMFGGGLLGDGRRPIAAGSGICRRVAEPFRKCAVSKSGWTSAQRCALKRVEIGRAASWQHDVDVLALGHAEARPVATPRRLPVPR
jgi:hypothetical protein